MIPSYDDRHITIELRAQVKNSENHVIFEISFSFDLGLGGKSAYVLSKIDEIFDWDFVRSGQLQDNVLGNLELKKSMPLSVKNEELPIDVAWAVSEDTDQEYPNYFNIIDEIGQFIGKPSVDKGDIEINLLATLTWRDEQDIPQSTVKNLSFTIKAIEAAEEFNQMADQVTWDMLSEQPTDGVTRNLLGTQSILSIGFDSVDFTVDADGINYFTISDPERRSSFIGQVHRPEYPARDGSVTLNVILRWKNLPPKSLLFF